jgi:hypothetical protein
MFALLKHTLGGGTKELLGRESSSKETRLADMGRPLASNLACCNGANEESDCCSRWPFEASPTCSQHAIVVDALRAHSLTGNNDENDDDDSDDEALDDVEDGDDDDETIDIDDKALAILALASSTLNFSSPSLERRTLHG